MTETRTKEQKRYQVHGTATVSVWMYIHADSPEEALRMANEGQYKELPEYGNDGDASWESVTEAMPL